MTTTVATAQGRLEGRPFDGVVRFAGIPYAAPPVGTCRFQPPHPPEPWAGTRDATAFGAVSWQSPGLLGGFLDRGSPNCSEDCLFLNVFTPACDDRARPVMVWIHGGGFTSGTGSVPWYDGSSFARRGDVVVVTINYRLGALGFAHLAELGDGYRSSGLNGILDQIAALEWVRANIAAFGGDPGNVTIFGESAGAMSVGTLLGLPAARGLFHKAIAQSGAAHNHLDPHLAAEVTGALLAALGADDLEAVLAADAADLLAAQEAVSADLLANPGRLAGRGGLALAMPFQPVVDGVVLPDPPLESVRAGLSAHVPLLVGTTLDEWNLFHLMSPGGLDDPALISRLDHMFGASFDGGGRHLADTYRVARPDATADEVWCAVLTDWIFRVPAIRLAEAQAHHQPDHTYAYLFSWASRAFGGKLGSCHALDVPFMWNNLDKGGVEIFLGDGPTPTHLAEAMHDAWWRFARDGRPGHDALPTWPAYDDATRATMGFGEKVEVLHDPAGAERAVWDGLR